MGACLSLSRAEEDDLDDGVGGGSGSGGSGGGGRGRGRSSGRRRGGRSGRRRSRSHDSSGEDDLSDSLTSSAAVLATKNRPLRHERVRWKSDVPLTEGQLKSKRDEFWDTAPAFEGKSEIW